MKTVSLKDVTIGNFKYSTDIEVSDTVAEALLQQGALRILQGAASGAWEKSLAYPGDGVKRPEKFKRTDIPYSDDGALALEEQYGKAMVEIGRNEKDEAIKESLGTFKNFKVTEYDGPEKAEPKYKAAKELLKVYLFLEDGKTGKMLASGEPRTAASFAESRGLQAPTEPWEEDTEFLKAVNDWQKAELAKKAEKD